MSNTIILKGHGIRKERIANATITPGHLVEVISTGKLQPHGTAGGNAQKAFAVEDDLQGKTITNDYAANDRVQYNVMERGSEVYAVLATNQTIDIGDPLESAGDGTLQKHVPANSAGVVEAVNSIVGYALEAVTTTSSTARIKIEVA